MELKHSQMFLFPKGVSVAQERAARPSLLIPRSQPKGSASWAGNLAGVLQ